MLNPPVNGKIQGLFKAFECFSSTFQGKFNFQELFKTVLCTFLACENPAAWLRCPVLTVHMNRPWLLKLFIQCTEKAKLVSVDVQTDLSLHSVFILGFEKQLGFLFIEK